MSWFEEQLNERRARDERLFERSFEELAATLSGGRAHGGTAEFLERDQAAAHRAIREIFSALSVPCQAPPEDVAGLQAQLAYMMAPTGMLKRRVELLGNWWKDAAGPMLGARRDGVPVALLPDWRGYRYRDPDTGAFRRVNAASAKLLEVDAYCFYRPLPQRKLHIPDLLVFIARSLTPFQYAVTAGVSFVITLIGMVTPYATQVLFSSVIPLGSPAALWPVAALLVGAAVSGAIYQIVNTLVGMGLQNRVNTAVKSAAMARLLSLPAKFFMDYSAGELSARLDSITELCGMLQNAVLNSGLSALFSLAYIFQMGSYAPALTVPALCVLGANLLYTVSATCLQLNHQRSQLRVSAKLRGMVFALFSGVQKIKLSGSERRMFARWADVYKEKARLEYRPPFIIRSRTAAALLFSFGELLVLFSAAIASGAAASDYIAFYAAFGLASTALLSVVGVTDTIAKIRPSLEMAEPILKAEPEVSQNKTVLTRLSGAVELSHVTFRYSEDGPAILDDLSLKISPNQYVAVVGKTGCGKSTLMRLLLGFQQPDKGAVYFDGKDLSTLDLKSVRRNIGVVLQNSKLFAGDIYSNIIVSAPWLSAEEAMEAAELAGVAEDIRSMPMGLHTVVSEGGGGISGGQKQRLMIARAIAPRPRLLMFDEATSALDNVTQKTVSDALAGLRCTRIVIAHRLSTIRQCDRILYLENGRIAEDGTFDALMEQDGAFADMVRRQMV